MHHTVTVEDTPCNRGMINKIILHAEVRGADDASEYLKPAAGAEGPQAPRPRHRLGPRQDRGRGHKGQHARAGGYHKVGFEGGQMPLQRRLPKSASPRAARAARCDEVRLHELDTGSRRDHRPDALRRPG
jgi:hypothetical protein